MNTKKVTAPLVHAKNHLTSMLPISPHIVTEHNGHTKGQCQTICEKKKKINYKHKR